ncbi:MAG: FtsW/RodA/SpoVE family cell cycle protein [Phycisphaerae bacterium]
MVRAFCPHRFVPQSSFCILHFRLLAFATYIRDIPRMPAPVPLNLTRLGWTLAASVLLLATIGVAAIHATEFADASGEQIHVDDAHSALQRLIDVVGLNTLKQIGFLLAGGGLVVGVIRAGYLRIGRLAYLVYWAVIAMLASLVIDRYLIDLPFAQEVRNTNRWFGYGAFRVQPSEFMKLALVLALARYLRFRTSYRTWVGLIPPMALTLMPMFLILKQPDLGTLLMLPPVLFAMLYSAGARVRHLGIVLGIGIAFAPLFYVFGMHEYQKDRIDVLLKQDAADERWHMSKGYQLRQSKIALGTGGLLGEGYREGEFVRYEGLLPEGHNDFIFAIVGNQWGFVGAVVLVLAYVIIVFIGVEVAMMTNDPFGRLLAVGIVVMIVFQAMLNICMTVGLAPITGMPLPFVSQGGSSLLTNCIAMGLLVSVAQRRPMLIANPPFEHGDE